MPQFLCQLKQAVPLRLILMVNNVGPPISIPEFTLEDWWPMEPQKGPPLPVFLGIFWPWYKLPPPPPPPPGLANLYGRVTDAETGSPIVGVLVSLNGRIITTNTDGAYSLTELTPGSYTIKSEKDGYETLVDDIAIVEGNNELSIEMVPVAVPPGLANLYGRVTDAETGSPIVGIVGIYAGRIITTDADGIYSLVELTPGSYTIKFDVDGYEPLVDDIAIVEGNNEFNAELVPLAGPPEFPGFSLLLANYPPGTAYWLADFPYMGYPEKITMRPIGEPGWITVNAPGTDTIRIVLLDESYQCIDPSCQRNYTFLFENGRHYLLDLAADELGTNPDPPPLPPEIPVDEPAIVSADLPSVQSGEEFTPTILAYLPEVNPGKTYWLLIVEAGAWEDKFTVASGQFISPGLAGIHGWIPLSSPDGIYTLTGICTGAGCEPAKAVMRWYEVGWRTAPAPPGNYPVKATAMLYAVVSADPTGIGLYHVKSYDLGAIGVLKVV